MLRRIIKKRNSERGQGFLELAISLIFLLVLASAMIDLGWAFYTLIALRDAAQEAAVYGSMCPLDVSSSPAVLNEVGITDRLTASASAPLDMNDVSEIRVCVIDPLNPAPDCDTGPTYNAQIRYGMRIEAEVQHDIRTPFLATFIGRTSYPLRVDVTDVILRLNEAGDQGCLTP